MDYDENVMAMISGAAAALDARGTARCSRHHRCSTQDHRLPDGFEVRVYDFGGIDVKNDSGEWITVASTPEACAELARIAMLAADGAARDTEHGGEPAHPED